MRARTSAKPAAKKSDKVLVLRCVREDGTSTNNFKWPKRGPVKAPDFRKSKTCGHGLHGWLWGEGDHFCSSVANDPKTKWLVVEVLARDIIDLGGKVKFPKGRVVFSGPREKATQYLHDHGGSGKKIIYATLTGGEGATLTGGNRATLTGGDYATLTGGYGATLTGGEGATLTGGYGATLTGGEGATLTGGDYATLTGGYGATLTGGDYATLTGGDYATLTGGYRATLTGGYRATLTGGEGAELRMRWFDGRRYRTAVFYVGEDGIQAGVAYRCDGGKIVKVEAGK